MKATIVGITRMAGIGKESKAAYDMVRVLMLNAIKPFAKEGFSRSGAGYEVLEVDCTAEAFPAISKLVFPWTGFIELVQEVRGGKLVSVVSGCRPA